jgi:hypothetical protein
VVAQAGTRRRGVAVVGAALLLLTTVGASASAGAPPTRYHVPAQPLELPAGLGCSFPVSGTPDDKAGYRVTEFSDGRTLFVGQGNPTMTNLETGQSIQPRFHFSRLQTTGPEPGTVDIELRGSFFSYFFPGEAGPYGRVEAPGALLAMTGRAVATYDPNADLFTDFSFDGKVTDLCAALAG